MYVSAQGNSRSCGARVNMVVSHKVIYTKCVLVTEVNCVDIVWSLKSTVHRVTLRVCCLDLDEYIRELCLPALSQIVVSLP